MANPVADVALEDRTARARIRDAALVLFAERGTKGATVRDIAKAAGVSGGLLRHHFGPKDGLRDACDSYVLAKLMRMKERAVLEGELANPAFMSAAQPEMLLIYRYLARSMIDGSPQAASMFDEMVELGEKWLERNDPGRMGLRGAARGHGARSVVAAQPAVQGAGSRHIQPRGPPAFGHSQGGLLFKTLAQTQTCHPGPRGNRAAPGAVT